jgi:hypothetical protein
MQILKETVQVMLLLVVVLLVGLVLQSLAPEPPDVKPIRMTVQR